MLWRMSLQQHSSLGGRHPQCYMGNVSSLQRPIISICWGHRDSRLLMASGPALYVVRVEHRMSSLQLLCQQTIASSLRDDKDISKLTLPPRLCSYLTTAFTPTIKVNNIFHLLMQLNVTHGELLSTNLGGDHFVKNE